MRTRRLLATIGAALLVLGAAYLYSAVESDAILAAHPPRGRFVEVEGTRLHYVDAGAGPPVVLVHGASTTLLDFEASIAPLLSREHRVIAFDRPGYGYSDRPGGPWVDPTHQARLLRGALARLDVGRATLVGHSLGGAVVLALALDHPEAVAGVVLVGGAAYPWEGGVSWSVRLVSTAFVGPLFASTVVLPASRLLLDAALEKTFEPNAPTARFVERTGLRLALLPGRFLASSEDVLGLSPFLEAQSRRYAGFRHPLLLLTGDADGVVPAWNHAHRLAALLPRARLVEFDDTGHMPHHVHPERVARLISEFVREQPTQGGTGQRAGEAVSSAPPAAAPPAP